MNKNDNKTFNEELEKELQSGLYNTHDEIQSQDFTVKVHREEYVVKRRFYDKEKALETVEDLKRDKSNIVEDNLEGQALSSDNEDEEVDWDKLVDAGLEFDPPIAQAAELKPGDQPVSLIKPVGLPVTEEEDKNLEKTFLVKLRTEIASDAPLDDDSHDDDTFNKEVEQEIDEVVIEEDETDDDGNQYEDEDQTADSKSETQEEQPEIVKPKSRYAPPAHHMQSESPKRSKRLLWGVAALVVLACLSALFWMPGSDKADLSTPANQTVKAVANPEPATPADAGSVAAVQKDKNGGPSPDTNTIPPQPVSETNSSQKKEDITSAPEAVTTPETMNKNGLTIVEPLPFTVHVSSYKLITEVDKAIAELGNMGHVAFSSLVTIPGKGDWYRIYAGCFRSMDEAASLASDIKRTLGENALAIKAPWAIQIGKPATSSEAGEQISKLYAGGYRAYLLTAPENQNSFRILIGAFSSKKAAATLVNALKKDKFKAEPVLR